MVGDAFSSSEEREAVQLIREIIVDLGEAFVPGAEGAADMATAAQTGNLTGLLEGGVEAAIDFIPAEKLLHLLRDANKLVALERKVERLLLLLQRIRSKRNLAKTKVPRRVPTSTSSGLSVALANGGWHTISGKLVMYCKQKDAGMFIEAIGHIEEAQKKQMEAVAGKILKAIEQRQHHARMMAMERSARVTKRLVRKDNGELILVFSAPGCGEAPIVIHNVTGELSAATFEKWQDFAMQKLLQNRGGGGGMRL